MLDAATQGQQLKQEKWFIAIFKVMIPALDTVQGSRGLAACITSHSSPVTFVLGQVFLLLYESTL